MDSDTIIDSEVTMLAGIAAAIRGDYIREGMLDPWANSPFAWIRILPSRVKGSIGEQLVAGWCAAKGFDVVRSPDSDADRIIGGQRMKITFSTLWKSGIYAFQQVRDQNYEYAICLGISPFDASCWVVPKPLLQQKLRSQHGGARGTDTKWFQFPASSPPEWLAGYGGTLGQAYEVPKSIER